LVVNNRGTVASPGATLSDDLEVQHVRDVVPQRTTSSWFVDVSFRRVMQQKHIRLRIKLTANLFNVSHQRLEPLCVFIHRALKCSAHCVDDDQNDGRWRFEGGVLRPGLSQQALILLDARDQSVHHCFVREGINVRILKEPRGWKVPECPSKRIGVLFFE